VSARQYAPAAQGITMWHREIGGRWYRFALVTAGWWGVGETGTLRVYRKFSPCGDWFESHTFKVTC
jgi:hypothetical protein